MRAEVEPVKEKSVNREMRILHNEAAMIEEAVADLIVALGPIISVLTTAPEQQPEPDMECPLAQSIAVANKKLQSVRGSIDSLIKAVEL